MGKAATTKRNGVTNRSAIHRWYRTVLGYSDELVEGMLDRFGIGSRHKVIDSFCGAATTLVECLKRGVSCVGIDTNPASCLVARLKDRSDIAPKPAAPLAGGRRRLLQGTVGERSLG